MLIEIIAFSDTLVYSLAKFISIMNNLEALGILEKFDNDARVASERVIRENNLSQAEFATIRSQFRELKSIRRALLEIGIYTHGKGYIL